MPSDESYGYGYGSATQRGIFWARLGRGWGHDLDKVDFSLDGILPARSPGKIRGGVYFGTFWTNGQGFLI